MSVMLEQDYASEAEYSEKESFGKTVARVLMLSLVVTALIAGLYMAFGGNEGTDPLAGSPASPTATGADKPAAVKPAALTYEQKVAKAADKLAGVSTANRRTELIKFLKVAGIPVTAESSPATAATRACEILGDGYAPSKLVTQVSAGGEYTKQQSKAFLLGATTLYCPTYAKNFR